MEEEENPNASSVKDLYFSQFLGDLGRPSLKNSRNALFTAAGGTTKQASLEPSMRERKILVVQGIDGKISLIKGQQDIRKMYTPPVNEQLMPSRNPFLNGQITDYLKQGLS